MALDDRARVQRLREAPRSDVTLSERVYRFCAALRGHLRREVSRLDGDACCSDLPPLSQEGGRAGFMVDGGAVIATGNVTAWYDHVAGGSSRSAGILVDLRTASSALPSLRAALRYDGVGEDPLHPVDEWFTGKVLLVGSLLRAKDVEHFDRAWEAVCDRHPAAGAYQGLRCEGGFAFGPLRGDPEGAFHFMRAVGRALGSAYFSILREER